MKFFWLFLLSCLTSLAAPNWQSSISATPLLRTPKSFTNSLGGWYESGAGVASFMLPEGPPLPGNLFTSPRVAYWSPLLGYPTSPFSPNTVYQLADQLPFHEFYAADSDKSIWCRINNGAILQTSGSLAFGISNRLTVILVFKLAGAQNSGRIFSVAGEASPVMGLIWGSDGHVTFTTAPDFFVIDSPAGKVLDGKLTFVSIRISPVLGSILRINQKLEHDSGPISTMIAAGENFCFGSDLNLDFGEAVFGRQNVNVFALALWKTDLSDSAIIALERYFVRRFSRSAIDYP